MNLVFAIVITILILIAIYLFARVYFEKVEDWYPSTTYVNTPTNLGIYPNTPNAPQKYNMYSPDASTDPVLRQNVDSWTNRPASQVGYPMTDRVYLTNRYPKGAPLLSNLASKAYLPETRGGPVPVPANTIRGMGPMLTSVRSDRDYAVGEWVYAGTAFTADPNDDTYGTVYQLTLDPVRELYEYSIRIKGVGVIPLTRLPSHYKLEDGDRFKIRGMEGKGDFIYQEDNEYVYMYV